MIEFRNVSFSYDRQQPVVEGLSFSIRKGESVGLIGANGAGKSTIMKLLLGLLSGDGQILVDGLELNKKNLAAVRQKIGFVLQDSDNQMFMPTVYEDMCFGPLNYGLSREETDARVDAVLKSLGIEKLKHCYNHKISGGEKRMAAIATILAMEPEAILMDEPSTALDPVNRRTVINTIRRLPQTKLIASHDLDMILDTCQRVILLSRGKIVADGPVEEILYNRELLEGNRMELPFCLQGRRENYR
ncbi:MAG: ABC transporter ATP-binding protein [Firmicutes bacterium]|nr:ABC transporter ATP-binding protein [Bacillota bacterium]MDY6160747.1 ABC transporter ATP-binding protein [Candidatus Faecousia sp.]